MYASIIKMVREGEIDDILIENGKSICKARITEFTVRSSGGLLWNELKVPTLEQIEQVLQLLHFSGKVHVKDKWLLQKELRDRGFALPKLVGGLKRACTL